MASSQLANSGVGVEAHLVGAAVFFWGSLVFVGRGLLTVDEHHTGRAHVAENTNPGSTPTRSALPRGMLLALGMAGAAAIVIELTAADWAAFRFTDDFATTASFGGLGFVAHTSGMMSSRFAGDWVEHRIGSRRLLQLATVLAAAGLLTATLIENRWVALAGFFVGGVGAAPFFPRLYDLAAQQPGRPGAGLGALTGGSRIATLATPGVIGLLANSSLSVGTAMAIVVGPSLVAFFVVSTRLHQETPEPTPEV